MSCLEHNLAIFDLLKLVTSQKSRAADFPCFPLCLNVSFKPLTVKELGVVFVNPVEMNHLALHQAGLDSLVPATDTALPCAAC